MSVIQNFPLGIASNVFCFVFFNYCHFSGECRHAIWVPCPARWADVRQHLGCHGQVRVRTGPPSVSTIQFHAGNCAISENPRACSSIPEWPSFSSGTLLTGAGYFLAVDFVCGILKRFMKEMAESDLANKQHIPDLN